MENVLTNAKVNTFDKENTFSPKYVGLMCALFFALIVGRSLNNTFFLAFAAVSLAVFVLSSTKHCIPMLLFLLPFSTLLKSNLNAISLFTVLFFIVVVKLVFSHLKIEVGVLLCIALFIVYNLLLSGLGQLTTMVTMASGVLMLYYLRSEDIDANSSITAFSFGICLSSVVALFKESLPIVDAFVDDTTLRLNGTDFVSRFSGLQGNPNYYTIDIILALSAIIVTMYNRKHRPINTVFLVLLPVFGLMSLSKSFLITLVLLIACWFVLSIRQGVGGMTRFVFIAVVGMAIAYYMAYDSINASLLRFMGDDTSSLEQVTTGRSDIWMDYVEALLGDFKMLFCGNGLNTVLETAGKGAHNTYLESLFSLGIFGSTILLSAIGFAIGKISLKNAVWVPFILLLVRMFAIGILTYDNLWFYLLILVLLSKESIEIQAESPLRV